MSALPIISELSKKGIRVRVEDSELVLSGLKGVLIDPLVSTIKKEKRALIQSLKTIKRKAGADWDEIANDPAQLKAFAELLMIVEMRKKGEVPSHYTAITECKYCGIVPIFEGCPPKVKGCPWCFNRLKGIKTPTIKE